MSDILTTAQVSGALQPMITIFSKLSVGVWLTSAYVVLGIFILCVLVQFFCFFLPSNQLLELPVESVTTPSSAVLITPVDIDSIQSLHLFGEQQSA